MRLVLPWFMGLLLLLLLLSWFANRSMFFPSRYPEGFWQLREALGAADVQFANPGGGTLHGWWLQPADPKRATLFLHGNAGNVTHRASAMREIVAAGSAVLVLDYRGYGKSTGHPTERGLYADAQAAYEELTRRGYPPNRIVLHGESLGTAVAVELATRRRCAGVVLEAPFPSARAVANRVLPLLGPFLVWGLDTGSRIGSVRAPVLIIHGEQDEIIDQDFGRQVYAAAAQPKHFWSVPGAGHNDLVAAAGPEYRERLRSFYESLEP